MAFPELSNHIVLVSEQTTPLYLGASIPKARACAVHALVTEKMRVPAGNLQSALEAEGREFHAYAIKNEEPKNILAALKQISAKYPVSTLAMNLTGGTKLMSLVGFGWAMSNSVLAYYIDTAHSRIILPRPQWQYEFLPDILDVEKLINLHGWHTLPSNPSRYTARYGQAAKALGKLAASEQGREAIRQMNAYITNSGSNKVFQVEKNQMQAWNQVLPILEGGNIVHSNERQISFQSEYDKKWCCGLWLEDYVHLALQNLESRGIITSFMTQTHVQRDGVTNEVDAMFTIDNRFYMVECKTERFKKTTGFTDNAARAIYKADSLYKRLGGAMAKVIICALDSMSEGDSARANSWEVSTVSGSKLVRLEEEIKSIIQGSKND